MMPRISDRPLAGVSRRQVMTGAAGLTFAFAIDRCGIAAAAALEDEATGISLSPWVSIAQSGLISIMSPAAETGQGSMTSLPLILAEELDANWDHVRVVPAPVVAKKSTETLLSAARCSRPAAQR
jgi:isoquinoline 1-oxidoreductase subunit beta